MAMRNLTAAEREAYGMPALDEDDQARRDAANQAEVLKAQEEGRTTQAPNGNIIALPPNAENGGSAATSEDAARFLRQGNVLTTDALARVQQGQPSGVTPVNTRGGSGGNVFENRPDRGYFEDRTLQQNKDRLGAEVAAVGARPVQQMQGATINPAAGQPGQGMFEADRAASAEARTRQMALADSLAASARGEGPSAAQMQMQQATDQSMASALALARSGRGNQAVALKNAMMQQGQISQQAANQSAQLRLAEQGQARQQLAGVLDQSRGADISQQGQALGMRGQDIGVATTQAGLNQDTAKTNLQASLDQQKTKDDLTQKYLAMGMSMDQAQLQANIAYEQLRVQNNTSRKAIEAGISANQGQQAMQGVGAGLAATGAIMAAALSDKRAKKNVTDGEEETRRFLKSIRPKGFDYKDEAHGKGRHIGVMAQDLEKGAPDIVFEDESDGLKRIDTRKALSASLAALGSIDRRLSKLEGRKNG